MIRDLMPYPACRDAGVPWLERVPAHWQTRRLRTLARQPIRNGVGESAQAFRTDWPRYIRITDIAGPRALRAKSLASLPPEIAAAARLEAGDLLLAAVGATYGKSYLYADEGTLACFAGYLVRVRPGAEVLPEFLSYWTESATYWDQVHGQVIQSTIQNFSAGRYKGLRVVLPTLDEQAAIVRFLDHADRRIRRYIAAKKKLIALLNEQRQAIIHRAVTRGLDPDVHFKPSGVEWLGDVPENWQVARLKSRLVRNDAGAWGTEFSEAGTIVLRSTEQTVSGNWSLINPARRVVSDYDRRRTLLRAGDLVVTKSSGSPAHIGKTSLVTPELESMACGFSNFMQRLRLDARTASGFVWLFINNSAGRQQLVYGSSSTTGLGNLSGTLLGNLWMAFPPRLEQGQIVENVATIAEPFDRSAAKAQGEIDLMREYRTRLITDVVTGKVDVREAAAKLSDEVEEPEPLDDVDVVTDWDESGDGANLDVVPEQVEA